MHIPVHRAGICALTRSPGRRRRETQGDGAAVHRHGGELRVGQFDLGPAAAFSLIYFLIILLLCFILYNWMQRVGTADKVGA